MTPNIQHRVDSVIRALSDIILPALPETANLANEQARLAIGHLMILKAQIPLAHAFEEEEARDARALGEAVLKVAHGGDATQSAAAALRGGLARERDAGGAAAEAQSINAAVVDVLNALAQDGAEASIKQATAITIEHEASRAMKDRKWFAAMGFDVEVTH